MLVRHLLKSAGKPNVRVTHEALAVLEHYSWPGNVRELKNLIDSALSVIEGSELDVKHLPHEFLGLSCGNRELSGLSDGRLADEMVCFEKTVLARAVRLSHGNMSKAAKRLGISRSTLYEKLRKHLLMTAHT